MIERQGEGGGRGEGGGGDFSTREVDNYVRKRDRQEWETGQRPTETKIFVGFWGLTSTLAMACMGLPNPMPIAHAPLIVYSKT